MSEFEMQPRRRRKPIPKWKRFLRRYGPSLMLLVLVICCVSMVAFTVWSVSSMLDEHNEKLEQMQKPPSSTTVPTTKGLDPEEVALALAEAEKMAAGYDYEGAMELLKEVHLYEQSAEIAAKLSELSCCRKYLSEILVLHCRSAAYRGNTVIKLEKMKYV